MDNPYARTPDDTPASRPAPNLPPVPDDAPEMPLPLHKQDLFKGRFGILGGIVTIIVVVALVVLYALHETDSERNRNKRAADHSQTLEQAYASGAPRIDKPWTVDDYRAFQTYVKSLDANKYPRYNSPKSGALFRKVISSSTEATKNTAPIWDPNNIENASWEVEDIPVSTSDSQAEAPLNFMTVFAQCAMPYIDAHNTREAYYGIEIAHLTGTTLIATRELFTGPDIAAMRNDPEMAEFYRPMSSALETQLETTFSDMLISAKVEQTIIARYLLDNGPALFECLMQADQKKIVTQTRRTWSAMEDAKARDLISQFAVTIENIHAGATPLLIPTQGASP